MLLVLIGLSSATVAFLALERHSRSAVARRRALARIGDYRRNISSSTDPRTARFGRRPTPIRVPTFLRSQLAVATGAGLLGLLAAKGLHQPPASSLLLALCAGLGGAVVPQSVMRARARRRRERIVGALPDTLDLLAVSVSAGLGMDSAIAKVSEVTSGALADELALVLTEIRVGESRQNALEHMARRLDLPEITALVRSLLQAEQLGVPLAEALTTRSAEARRRRFLEIEEQAGKAPVKMLFPTVFFIFPALFVAILAPAVLVMLRTL
jgi:tight adherence protein C